MSLKRRYTRRLAGSMAARRMARFRGRRLVTSLEGKFLLWARNLEIWRKARET